MRAGVFFGPGDDVLVLSCAGEADGRKDVGEGSTSVGTDGCLCAFKLGGGSALATLTPCHAPPGGLALLGDDHVLAAQLPRIKRDRGGCRWRVCALLGMAAERFATASILSPRGCERPGSIAKRCADCGGRVQREALPVGRVFR